MVGSNIGLAFLVALLTLVGLCVAIWRIATGTSTQRAQGCLSLVMVVVMLAVVIAVSIAFLRVGLAGGFWGAPTAPSLPTAGPYHTFPTMQPIYSTPIPAVGR